MKSAKFLVFLFSILMTLNSCEEVIDVDLKEVEPSLVVEALVTDSLAPYIARLTTTKDFFSADRAPVVTTAFVTISDDAGNLDTLKHASNGIYLTSPFNLKRGVANRKYTLNISYKNKTYTATSVLRPKMQLDSITYKFIQGNPLQKKGYYLTVHAQDRPEKGDYFQIRISRNDTVQIFPVKYLTDGDLFLEPEKPIRADLPYQFNLNDSATADFFSITKEYYEYLFNLNNQLQAGGSPFDPQPANLPTNISGGAFGYFVVAGVVQKKFKIK